MHLPGPVLSLPKAFGCSNGLLYKEHRKAGHRISCNDTKSVKIYHLFFFISPLEDFL